MWQEGYPQDPHKTAFTVTMVPFWSQEAVAELLKRKEKLQNLQSRLAAAGQP